MIAAEGAGYFLKLFLVSVPARLGRPGQYLMITVVALDRRVKENDIGSFLRAADFILNRGSSADSKIDSLAGGRISHFFQHRVASELMMFLEREIGKICLIFG